MNEVAEEAEDVMTDLQRRYHVEKMEKLGIAKSKTRYSKSLQDTLPHFAVMIGGIFPDDKQASIYVVGMDGLAERAEKFESLGSGSAYAEYLLAKFYRPDMNIERSAVLAIYAVEEVKKIDPGCGGTTQLITIENGYMKRWESEEVSRLVSEIEAREKVLIDGWWGHKTTAASA